MHKSNQRFCSNRLWLAVMTCSIDGDSLWVERFTPFMAIPLKLGPGMTGIFGTGWVNWVNECTWCKCRHVDLPRAGHCWWRRLGSYLHLQDSARIWDSKGPSCPWIFWGLKDIKTVEQGLQQHLQEPFNTVVPEENAPIARPCAGQNVE